MCSAIFRPSRPGEEALLKSVWLGGYPGDEAYRDAFFRTCFHPDLGTVADNGRAICSAIFRITGNSVRLPDGTHRSADYLYALATPPKHRGQGYGQNTIRAAAEFSRAQGAEVVCFSPASSSLARWYEGFLHTKPFAARQKLTIQAGSSGSVALSPLSPEDYGARREQILFGTPHGTLSADYLRLQEEFCRLCGGGLYAVSSPAGEGICIAERTERGSLKLCELLTDGDPSALTGGICRALGAPGGTAFLPAFAPIPGAALCQDVVYVPNKEESPLIRTEVPLYWGPILD